MGYDQKIHGRDKVVQPEIDDLYGEERIINTVDWLLCKVRLLRASILCFRPIIYECVGSAH